ncbi:MAG: hypothetical protein AAGM84_17485 [Pseudomonadota bacterium]
MTNTARSTQRLLARLATCLVLAVAGFVGSTPAALAERCQVVTPEFQTAIQLKGHLFKVFGDWDLAKRMVLPYRSKGARFAAMLGYSDDGAGLKSQPKFREIRLSCLPASTVEKQVIFAKPPVGDYFYPDLYPWHAGHYDLPAETRQMITACYKAPVMADAPKDACAQARKLVATDVGNRVEFAEYERKSLDTLAANLDLRACFVDRFDAACDAVLDRLEPTAKQPTASYRSTASDILAGRAASPRLTHAALVAAPFSMTANDAPSSAASGQVASRDGEPTIREIVDSAAQDQVLTTMTALRVAYGSDFTIREKLSNGGALFNRYIAKFPKEGATTKQLCNFTFGRDFKVKRDDGTVVMHQTVLWRIPLGAYLRDRKQNADGYAYVSRVDPDLSSAVFLESDEIVLQSCRGRSDAKRLKIGSICDDIPTFSTRGARGDKTLDALKAHIISCSLYAKD